MSAAKEIRGKIRSIANTQKITRAMEMVAASKMRKAQDRMLRAQPYSVKILSVIGHLANGHAEYHHPYLENREMKRAGFIVVTTDRGLCGGLNSNLLRHTLQHIKKIKDQGADISLCLIGSKAESFFRRVGGDVLSYADHMGDAPSLSDLVGVVSVMLTAYTEGKIDALFLCSNAFVNTMKQTPTVQAILPVTPSIDEKSEHHWDYIYEPDDAKQLLTLLLTRYIESQVYRGVIENIACEQAARMVAMKSATDNATDLMDDLHLVYHKARQAAITRELTEIVAGAAAV